MLNVIFDMDGTLIDSEGAICKAINAIRRDKNFLPLEESFIKDVLHNPNLSCPKIFYKIDDFAHPSYKVGFESYFNTAYTQYAKIFDGVKEMLQTCKERGYFLAIASNAPHSELDGILKQHAILEFFDMIIGSQKGVESKPSAMMIERILQNASFEKSVFVGNGAKDSGAAKNAGIPYLHAKWGEIVLRDNEFCDAKMLLHLLQSYEA